MSVKTDVARGPTVRNDWLQVGAVTGALFGISVGLLLAVGGSMPDIGAYIGMPTLLGRWLLHMAIAFTLSIAFAGILATARFNQYADRLRTLVPMGLAWGIVTWVVLDVVVLAYMGVAFDAPGAVFPNVAVEDAIPTLVLSVFLALFYYVTRQWIITGRAAQ